jgi:hypothetical protein
MMLGAEAMLGVTIGWVVAAWRLRKHEAAQGWLVMSAPLAYMFFQTAWLYSIKDVARVSEAQALDMIGLTSSELHALPRHHAGVGVRYCRHRSGDGDLQQAA